MPQWFDLGTAKLRFVKEEGFEESMLILSGVVMNSPEWEACQGTPLGFRPSPTGKPFLIRPFSPTKQPKLSEFRTVFPLARLVQVAKEDIRLRIEGGAKLSPQEMAVAAAMRVAAPVGMNLLSDRVFERPDGVRFIVDAEGNRREDGALPAAFMLRADGTNLVSCVKGFIVGLLAGSHADVADVARFVDVLYGRGAAEDLAKVQEVAQLIESEMANRVLEKHKVAGDSAYREAQLLYENSPPYIGAQKSAGAVPLPLAVAAQELVRAFGGEGQVPIYIPHLFDGAIAAMLGPSFVTLTDPADPESSDGRLRPLIPSSVNLVERTLAESVPPHRQSVLNMENVLPESLAQMRTALSRRHPNGLTILMFPEYTSEVDAERQVEKERVNTFLQALQGDFDVLGIGQLSPVMRRKMNIKPGLMTVTVGRKFSAKERRLRADDWIPRKLDIMYDWDALRTFTNDVLVRVHESAGHKMTPEEEAALRANENAENSYQLPYEAFSRNGAVELMIPRNLAGPTYKALQSLQDRVGNIDEYVRNAIGFDEASFAYLAPEQCDAAALMINALDRGKGFVLDDQTGAGKGVTIAATVAYAWERGLPVIFVTKQDNLFSDFYRDLKKTGLHQKMRPLVLNHTAQIIDQFSDDLDKVASGVSRKKFTENFQFGLDGFDNPNIVFCTYSQFSKGEDSDKSEWIKSIAGNAIVIFDESHIAAGDTSQLGTVCTTVANTAKGVIYSSASWLKDARQMAFYGRVLPDSIDTNMVSEAMQAGGESIQEVFTSMLAEDGLFIRRERDASQLEITINVDDARVAGNAQISDQVALILQGLQRLCGVTDQVGRRLTRTQVHKLDTAQKYISSVLDRAANASRAALESMRARAVGDTNGAADAPDEEEDWNEAVMQEAARQAAALVASTYNQQDLAEGETMAAHAEGENEEFLASGHATNVFDLLSLQADEAQAVLDNGGRIETGLESLIDIRVEDLGLTADQASRLAADIDAVGEDRDSVRRLKAELRKLTKMMDSVRTQTTSFGSLLFITQRTLNVALQARFAGEQAVKEIQQGRKPIIFLEQTFELRLKEAIAEPDTVKNEDGTYRIRPQTLKRTLRALYDTVVKMTHVDAEGQRIEGTVLDSQFMASEEERDAIKEGLATLDDMIEQLPDDLHCSPIDTICNAIRAAGYSVGEATGRKFKATEMHHDYWVVAPRTTAESKITNIERAFNFGGYDALVGNKAMSTGMSLHASSEFTDQRQRTEMFCQVFGDIVDYVQAIGRADRRGQVIPPQVQMLASGLQSEARIMMVHYANLRKLFASATSNRSSRFELHELPDLFNNVGDASVRDFLQANPGIATRLGVPFQSFMPIAIHPDGTEINAPMHGLAKRAVSRLDLLPEKESRTVYQEITYNFNEVVAELDEQGINPLRTNVLDMAAYDAAAITSCEDLMPARLNDSGEVDSVFDEAVQLQTVTTRFKVAARKWNDVLGEIEHNTRVMFMESRAGRAKGETPDFVPDASVAPIYNSAGTDVHGPMIGAIKMVPSGLRERVEKMFDAMLIMMRSSDAARIGADQTINAERDTDESGNRLITPTAVINRRREWLLSHLQHFMPGQYVIVRERNFGMGEEKVLKGAVTSLTLPPRGRETNLARWVITVQMAGWTKPQRFTLADLYKKQFIGTDLWLPATAQIDDGFLTREVPEEFNAYMERDHVKKRYVLCGNLFRAASIAAKHKIGAGAVLQMPGEAPRRVINIRSTLTKNNIYATVPVELAPDSVTALFCTTWAALNRPPSKNSSYWQDFLRTGLDSRGLHSNPDSKNADVSIYWLPTRANWIADVMDGVSDEVISEERADEQELTPADTSQLLAGVGARVRKTCLDREEQSALARSINDELGCEAVSVQRGRADAATVRILLRFKDKDGNRDSDDVIKNKLAVFTRAVMRATETRKFYSTSPAMRLLAMSVTEHSREQSRALREAAGEAKMMRLQMRRLNLDTGDVDQEISVREDGEELNEHDDDDPDLIEYERDGGGDTLAA